MLAPGAMLLKNWLISLCTYVCVCERETERDVLTHFTSVNTKKISVSRSMHVNKELLRSLWAWVRTASQGQHLKLAACALRGKTRADNYIDQQSCHTLTPLCPSGLSTLSEPVSLFWVLSYDDLFLVFYFSTFSRLFLRALIKQEQLWHNYYNRIVFYIP